MLVDMFYLHLFLSMISYRIRNLSDCDLPPHPSSTFFVLQLFFLKDSYWQWVRVEHKAILGMLGGSSLVQNHVRSQSLRRQMKDTTLIILGLNAAVPKDTVPAPVIRTRVDATMLQQPPAPVMGTEVDTTMLQQVPALVMGTEVDTTMLQQVPAPIMGTEVDTTMLQQVPAPIMGTEVDTTMLQLVTTPVMDTGMDTTIQANSGDECKANVHIYQSPLVAGKKKGLRYSNDGESLGASDDSHYNRRSECELGESILYINP